MTRGARVLWGLGDLVPTLVVGAVIAGSQRFLLSAALLTACAVLSLVGNLRVVRIIRSYPTYRLTADASRAERPAADAKALLALLVPAGPHFFGDTGLSLMLALLLLVGFVLQLAHPKPPGLLLLAIGYHLHAVRFSNGEEGRVYVRQRRLSPGDALLVTETAEKLWMGEAVS